VKYASCSRAHGSQKGMPLIFTTAGRRQGRSVPLRTWHCPCSLVVLLKKPSFPGFYDRTKILQGSREQRVLQKEDIPRPLVGKGREPLGVRIPVGGLFYLRILGGGESLFVGMAAV
jgi:hypothetical protein